MGAPSEQSDHLDDHFGGQFGGVMPDMPLSTEVVRAMADHYYELAHQLDRLANHRALLDTDPQYAQRIEEAEDQLVGDELLMEMQEPQPASKARRAPVRRGVYHNPNPAPSTPPPDMRH